MLMDERATREAIAAYLSTLRRAMARAEQPGLAMRGDQTAATLIGLRPLF
jgi:hypothetical protein